MVTVTASPDVLFTLFYILFCAGFVLQFREFSGLGLSPEAMLSSWISCTEDMQIIEFNMRRCAATVVLQAALPVGKTNRSPRC